jgi:hypothetical protein
MLVALVAVSAMSAVVVASASAIRPEFNFSGDRLPVKFSTSSGASTLETTNGHKVSCTSASSSGEITSLNTTNNSAVAFKGCTMKVIGLTVNCQSGATVGEIVTEKLKSELGYVKSTKIVDSLLQSSTAADFSKFKCGGLPEFTVKGAVIGVISPINKRASTFTLAYEQSAGKQKYTEQEGLAEKQLLTTTISGEVFESGIAETTTVTFAEEVAIEG